MFTPLIDQKAKSITLPYTTGNKVKDTIMIVANDFETVRDEIQVIIDKYKSLKDSLGRDLNTYEYTLRSDAVWEVLRKYNKK